MAKHGTAMASAITACIIGLAGASTGSWAAPSETERLKADVQRLMNRLVDAQNKSNEQIRRIIDLERQLREKDKQLVSCEKDAGRGSIRR